MPKLPSPKVGRRSEASALPVAEALASNPAEDVGIQPLFRVPEGTAWAFGWEEPCYREEIQVEVGSALEKAVLKAAKEYPDAPLPGVVELTCDLSFRESEHGLFLRASALVKDENGDRLDSYALIDTRDQAVSPADVLGLMGESGLLPWFEAGFPMHHQMLKQERPFCDYAGLGLNFKKGDPTSEIGLTPEGQWLVKDHLAGIIFEAKPDKDLGGGEKPWLPGPNGISYHWKETPVGVFEPNPEVRNLNVGDWDDIHANRGGLTPEEAALCRVAVIENRRYNHAAHVFTDVFSERANKATKSMDLRTLKTLDQWDPPHLFRLAIKNVFNKAGADINAQVGAALELNEFETRALNLYLEASASKYGASGPVATARAQFGQKVDALLEVGKLKEADDFVMCLPEMFQVGLGIKTMKYEERLMALASAVAEPMKLESAACAGYPLGTVTDGYSLVGIVKELHLNEEDLYEGDLIDRIEKYAWYVLQDVPLAKLDSEEWSTDPGLVKGYEEQYRTTNSCPPIVVSALSDDTSIIDGTHRVKALEGAGATHIKAWVGQTKRPDNFPEGVRMGFGLAFLPGTPVPNALELPPSKPDWNASYSLWQSIPAEIQTFIQGNPFESFGLDCFSESERWALRLKEAFPDNRIELVEGLFCWEVYGVEDGDDDQSMEEEHRWVEVNGDVFDPTASQFDIPGLVNSEYQERDKWEIGTDRPDWLDYN